MRLIWSVPLLIVLVLTGGISPIAAKGSQRTSFHHALVPGGEASWSAAVTNGGGQITYIDYKYPPKMEPVPNGIWLSNSDGTRRHEIDADTYGTGVLGWTPDGSKMIFSTKTGGATWEVNADGSGGHMIAGAPLGPLRLSPDGTKVAYEYYNPNTGSPLKIANINGSHSLKLWDFGVYQVQWTPNAKDLIVTDFGSRLWEIPTDGSAASQSANAKFIPVTIDGTQQTFNTFSLSPDGSKIVFLPYSGGQLYTVPISGGAATPVRGTPTTSGSPQWSPDGKMIAFGGENKAGNGGNVFTIPAAGGTPVNLGISGVPQPWRPTSSYRVSGTITEGSCSQDQCAKPAPLPGVVVTAKPLGPQSGGKATSGRDGTWSMLLSPGDYTLTPKDGQNEFDPASRDLSLNGDTTGQDFNVCIGTPAKSASTLRTMSLRGSGGTQLTLTTESDKFPSAGLSVTRSSTKFGRLPWRATTETIVTKNDIADGTPDNVINDGGSGALAADRLLGGPAAKLSIIDGLATLHNVTPASFVDFFPPILAGNDNLKHTISWLFIAARS